MNLSIFRYLLFLALFFRQPVVQAETTIDDLREVFGRFQNQVVEQSFDLADGQSVVWVHLAQARSSKATVVIVPGRTESRLSYFEIAMGIFDHGYNVAILEHPGQGKSYRHVQLDDVGHIDSFEEYVQAYDRFLLEVRGRLPAPYFLYAASMGGAIALLSPKTSKFFDKAVLSAPMFEIKAFELPRSVVNFALAFKNFLFGAQAYAPFTGPFDPNSSFEKNRYANSRVRFSFNNELYQNHPGFRVGGPSVRWVQEALTVTERLRGKIRILNLPFLIIQADQDDFVKNETHREFCTSMPRCQIRVLNNSRHALQLDRDENLKRLIDVTVEFTSKL